MKSLKCKICYYVGQAFDRFEVIVKFEDSKLSTRVQCKKTATLDENWDMYEGIIEFDDSCQFKGLAHLESTEYWENEDMHKLSKTLEGGITLETTKTVLESIEFEPYQEIQWNPIEEDSIKVIRNDQTMSPLHYIVNSTVYFLGLIEKTDGQQEAIEEIGPILRNHTHILDRLNSNEADTIVLNLVQIYSNILSDLITSQEIQNSRELQKHFESQGYAEAISKLRNKLKSTKIFNLKKYGRREENDSYNRFKTILGYIR